MENTNSSAAEPQPKFSEIYFLQKTKYGGIGARADYEPSQDELLAYKDTYIKAMARYKVEILKIKAEPDRQNILYKVLLKEGISIPLLQEIQYDLELMKANAMVMVNPRSTSAT